MSGSDGGARASEARPATPSVSVDLGVPVVPMDNSDSEGEGLSRAPREATRAQAAAYKASPVKVPKVAIDE